MIQQRKLLGIVSAKDLMTTDDNVLIEDIMETEIISVSTLTDKEDVAHQLRKYDLLALPVLDTDGLLVGIVTFDDAMDVMVEEATEDITKMAAVSPSEKLTLKYPPGTRKTQNPMASGADVFFYYHRNHHHPL